LIHDPSASPWLRGPLHDDVEPHFRAGPPAGRPMIDPQGSCTAQAAEPRSDAVWSRADAKALLAGVAGGAPVLLAEDDPINRKVATAILSDVGLRVESVRDGAEAVRRVSEHAYRLILMDMQMPVMDGLEATRRIRALAALAWVPIIALTGNADDDDVLRCREAGMNDFVAKPIAPARFYATLVRWLAPATTTG